MPTMPGLPTRPCFYDIDLNLESEEVEGLFWSTAMLSNVVLSTANFAVNETFQFHDFCNLSLDIYAELLYVADMFDILWDFNK